MKFRKLSFLFVLLLAVALIASTVSIDRKVLYNGWHFISMSGKIVPADTTQYSSLFSLGRDRDAATATYPLCAYVDVDSATYGTNGDVTYLITIEGSALTTTGFVVVDTLYNSTDADSTVLADDTWTLNPNLKPKYPYYRIKVAATAVAVATPDTNSYVIKIW